MLVICIMRWFCLAGWQPEDLILKVRTDPTNKSWRNGWTLHQLSPYLKVCERKPTSREISVSVGIHGATGNNTTSQTSKFTFHQHCFHIESITSNYISIDSMQESFHSLSGYRSEDIILKFEHNSWFSNFPHNCWTLYQASLDLRWFLVSEGIHGATTGNYIASQTLQIHVSSTLISDWLNHVRLHQHWINAHHT